MRWASSQLQQQQDLITKIQFFLRRMNLPLILSRPISLITSKPTFLQKTNSFSSPVPSSGFDQNFATINEIQSILETSTSIESSLETVVPFLSPKIVESVVEEQYNVQLGFRFFNWAMKRKQFRTWNSHDLMIQMLRETQGFETAWELLEELKKGGILIIPQVFTVLISAYASSGMAGNAFESFAKMGEFNCRPNTFTYNTVLSILIEQEVFPLAMALYNQMLKSDCRPNRATFSILIDGLCKAGKTEDALSLYDEMTVKGISPDTMIYTIIISGLCQAKRTDDALRLVGTMKQNDCSPDSVTYNALLSGLSKLGKVDEAFELLKAFREGGFVLGLNGYSCLIDGLFKLGRFEAACQCYRKMLEEKVEPDHIIYTIMIKGYSEVGKVKDAVQLLNEMTDRGLVPDTFCYNTLIKGLCDAGLLDKARSLQLEISKHDQFPDSATYTIMICGLCKEGLIHKAQRIFHKMGKLGCFPTVMTFNALINGLCKDGEMGKAHILFHKMEMGRNPSLFLRLSQGSDRVLDSASLLALVERLCDSGLMVKAYKLLSELADSGVVPNVTTYNVLIKGLCKTRNIYGAFKLFEELQLKGYAPDAVTYGTLIHGLQRVKREDDAFMVFEQMEKNGCTPTLEIYKLLMTAFCRRGRVSRAFPIWLKYISKKSVLPIEEVEVIKVVHEQFERGDIERAVKSLLEMDLRLNVVDSSPYTIWLIGFCRAGRLDEALRIFSALKEYKVDVTPPSCVVLMNSLYNEKKIGMAIDVFRYTLDKHFLLMPHVCNWLIRKLCHRNNRKVAHELIQRMRIAGYDLNVYLRRSTLALL